MPTLFSNTVDRLRGLAGRAAFAEHTDRQLLERFVASGDEAAFETLVQRHGALVLGVCRRVLANAHDAEDAFQATFLVLARKAGSLPWHESIKNWLHGVAYRVALKARTQALRRKRKEREAQQEQTAPTLESAWGDLRPVLDEELAKLPAKYRAPLLLCYLEGKTRDEAAEELGWSTGSVKGRLERGRELLRSRLLRRGLPLCAVLCASFLAESAASASVPPSLAALAVKSSITFTAGSLSAVSQPVIHLAQGVLNAMLLAKIKMSAFGLLIIAVVGVGGLALQDAIAGRAQEQAALVLAAAQDGDRKDGDRKQDGDKKKDGDRKDEVRKDGDRKEVDKKKDGDRKDGDRKEDPNPRKKDGERVDDGRKKDPPREFSVRGIIKGLDLQKGTIRVVGIGEGNQTDQTYNLAGKDIKVATSSETPLKLADVREGLFAYLQLNNQDDVVAIRIDMPRLFTFIVRVDAENNQITIRKEREQVALKVAADAKLFIQERKAKLEDFQPGVEAHFTLNLETDTVLAISAVAKGPAAREGDKPGVREGDKPGVREGDEARPSGVGYIIGVTPGLDKTTIEVLTGAEGDLEPRTYIVPKEAKVVLRAERLVSDIGAAELKKGIRVTLFLEADNKTVKRLDANAPIVRAILKNIDAAGKKLMVGDKAVTLAADARITKDRQEVTLADVKDGDRAVVVLSLDRTQVLSLAIFRPEGDGRE